MMWEVHFGGKVRRWTEEDLRNKLRKNKVSGVELARRVGDDEWTPLYATDLYRETVPHTGDPKSGVLRRIWSPFIGHSTAFVTVRCVVVGKRRTATLGSVVGHWPRVPRCRGDYCHG